MDFYNTTGIYDNSTWGNHGVLAGGLNISNLTTGKRGEGMEFNGSGGYINAGSGASLDDLTNSTYVAWVYPTEVTKMRGIIDKRYKSFLLDEYVTTPAVGFFVSRSSVNMNIYCPTTIQLNTWTHVAFVWDGVLGSGTTGKFYVNGIKCNPTATNWGSGDTSSEASYNLAIGARYDGATYNFNGTIDEVMIFSRALTPEDLIATYH